MSEVMDLLWPEGNDDGELFVRGHVADDEARRLLLAGSDNLDELAAGLADSRCAGEDRCATSDEIADVAEKLIAAARVERIYARWSCESTLDPSEYPGQRVLRCYNERGRGRFPVTRVTLWPPMPCMVVLHEAVGVYDCRRCGRRWRGPTEPPGRCLNGPVDCAQRRGDERGPFSEVLEELEHAEVAEP